ncbi:DUF5590 domain-containing protein [Gracilibacillus sp. S3-1-1]|uniref:DUF5590 domain-containing protein n=1 Tax=Gracilibacillus pellucidus TaxID=3095368 RepID=A0ACC6M5F7_9BACI|nr:DUF5590 domain-containing protein [Gracilibacillus sp. S3-1-1]MDX8046145.1 DUF5590 domain-containing protein [Gracilibacillus sp. S3-1-1]
MKKLYSPFIGLNKLLVTVTIAIIVLLAAITYFIIVYQDAINSKTEYFDEITELVKENTSLNVIHSIERYHGDQLYYVVDGETDDNEAVFTFVYQPDKDEDNNEDEWDFKVFKKDAFYSEDTLLAEWQNRCSGCEYLGSEIGIDNDIPILEIKYFDNQDRLVYENVVLKDKSHYRLTLNPSFQ